MDRLLPLLLTLAWLALGAGLMFKVIPDVQFGTNVWGILGPFVGAYLKTQAPASQPGGAAAQPTQG